MTLSREESEAPAQAELPAKPRLSVVVVLAMLLGILMTVLMAGGYFNLRRIDALQAEVEQTRSALKDKSRAVQDMQNQIEALSKQMNLLKEYSIARSAQDHPARSEHEAPPPASASKTQDVPVSDKATVVQAATAKASGKPANKSENNSAQLDCVLMGKSAAEQTATLKRCVNLLEPAARNP